MNSGNIVSRELKENDWDMLIDVIKSGNCVLMLGPEIAMEMRYNKYIPLVQILAEQLITNLDIKNVDMYNLFQVSECFENQFDRQYLGSSVKKFYNNHMANIQKQVFIDLATIPIPLIISSSYDDLFYEELCKIKGKSNVNYEYYHFNGVNLKNEYIYTSENPLVYNLYGSLRDTASLVLTESDLLNFLLGVTKFLPKYIRSQFSDTRKSFLFLGFGFKHWYLRILLHFLSNRQARKSRSFAMESFANTNNINYGSIFYYYNGFKINIYDTELNLFVRELRSRYEKSNISEYGAINFRKPKIFICHANEDKANARILYEKLKDEDFDPWFDQEDLRGGDLWPSLIQKTINDKNKIDYFVVLQSKALHKKIEGYVNLEIECALARQKMIKKPFRFLIPVKIEDCPIDGELEGFHSINYYELNGFERLVNTIKMDCEMRKRV